MNTEFVGPQTERAVANWGGGPTPRPVIRALSLVKEAALTAARESDRSEGRERWSDETWSLIVTCLREIREGTHDALFRVPLAQGGAGTSLNMNMNEAVSFLVESKGGPSLHAVDDINRFQSTNDTVSTAATILAYESLQVIEGRVIRLQEALVSLERRWSQQTMVARTELQDALPITVGQVFAAAAGPFERDRWRLSKLKERVRTVALGGTAVGTGFGAPPSYVFAAERHLRALTGLPLSRSQNLVDEISHLDKFSEWASGMRQLAENLFRWSQDLLYYTSSAVGEFGHPRLQAASSQMPAKTNPVLLEYVSGLALSAQGEALKISSYAQNGRLQLNPYLPFLIDSLLSLTDQLDRALEAMSDRLLPQLLVFASVLDRHLAGSPALLNALAPRLGYDELARLAPILAEAAPQSIEDLRSLLCRELDLDPEEARRLVDPLILAQGRTP